MALQEKFKSLAKIMEIIIGFMYRKTLPHRSGIKVKGEIHYKYLIYFAICFIIAFIVMIMFKQDFSPVNRAVYLSTAFMLAFYTSFIAFVRTNIQLKREENDRILLSDRLYVQSLIPYVLFLQLLTSLSYI